MDNAARTTEELTKAQDCAEQLGADLRAALSGASPVEALVLTPLIRRAQELSQDIHQLLAARRATE